MTYLILSSLILISSVVTVAGTSAKSHHGRTLKHKEQSEIVVQRHQEQSEIVVQRHQEQSAIVVAESTPSDAIDRPTQAASAEATVPRSDKKQALASSMSPMASFLASEAKVMESTSPKAKLQQQVVSLIWLEQVFKQNLNSMEEESYRAKVAENQAALEKEGSKETAKMVSDMRTQLNEFSSPFFRKAVQEELKEIEARKQVLLDKIVGDSDTEKKETQSDSNSKKVKILPGLDDESEMPFSNDQEEEEEKPAEKKEKKEKEAKEEELDEEAFGFSNKQIRKLGQGFFITAMVCVACCLSGILIAVAVKVQTHKYSDGRDA